MDKRKKEMDKRKKEMDKRKKEMKSDKLTSIMRDLRRMIEDEDADNEFTQALSNAVVYIDYAKVQINSKDAYKVVPVIVARGH